jgi:hypothetical protein
MDVAKQSTKQANRQNQSEKQSTKQASKPTKQQPNNQSIKPLKDGSYQRRCAYQQRQMTFLKELFDNLAVFERQLCTVETHAGAHTAELKLV